MKTKNRATIYAVLAAALYAINVPLSKILLNYVEPTMIALFVFKEVISKRLWFAIALVTVASIVLSFEGAGSFTFNQGSLFVLGAAKTSAYYSIAPFLGVAFSMLLLSERPSIQFYVALVIMVISTYFMVKDTIELQHTHEHEHTHIHEHSHDDIVHTHEHTHVHTHLHTHIGDSENHSHEHELYDHQHVHYA